MEHYKLTRPIAYDGETITALHLDLEGLTTGDLERSERQARMLLAKKETMHVPETNKKYLCCVAAKAAKVKIDLIKSLSGKDYTQVCLLVQNFLLDGDSGLEELEDDRTPDPAPENSGTPSSTTPFPRTPDTSTESPAALTI